MPSLLMSLVLLAPLAAADPGAGAEPGKIPLNVLYLARTDDAERTRAFTEFLTGSFEQCTVTKRVEFKPELLDGVDVVVLDWSQGELHEPADSPVGALETWRTPTVLLGSAGLLMAEAWKVIGDAG